VYAAGRWCCTGWAWINTIALFIGSSCGVPVGGEILILIYKCKTRKDLSWPAAVICV
jgi:hypothetical protein